ncbi:MAG: 2-C-methyl-D-erythritol 4-phosphate cytidylyltransferase [Chlamydiota bacterium]|jgi:2-C-methyl-D-erythritol 4-phosphate cytidylyltransferase
MFQNVKVAAILLMAGSGQRVGDRTPKQFLPLGNMLVYEHALGALQASSWFDEIVLVCHPEWVERVGQNYPNLTIVAGKTTRQGSSLAGLQAIRSAPTIVLIHEAVRPFVSQKIIYDNIREALVSGAVDTCIPTADTIICSATGQKIDAIPERSALFRGQTPQTFWLDRIIEAHEKATVSNATDDCQLVVAQGYPVTIVPGSGENFKITSPLDLALANEQYKLLTNTTRLTSKFY